MFARVLVADCRPGTVDRVVAKVEESLIGPLRQISGFVSYRIVKVDEQTLVALGLFLTRRGAERMEALAAEWRTNIAAEEILSSQPYVGEVILDAGPAPREWHPSHAVGQAQPTH